jgi:ribosome-associated toxin RatA of RatAB toxin-antitoxin module
MKRVHKSVLLWYAPREMYDLVVGIEDYPRFLPWCDRAEVLEHQTDGMTARLTLVKAGLRHAFTTRNRHLPGERVDVALVDGPFSMLEGSWRFMALGRPGSGTVARGDSLERACRVEFDLRYVFASAALAAAVSPVFDRVADTLVDCFVRRAEQVYGIR